MPWVLALALALGAVAAPAAAPGWLDQIEVAEATGEDLTAGGRPVQAGFVARPGTRLELASGGRAILRVAEMGHIRMEGPATFEVAAGKRPGLSVLRGKLLAALPALRGRFYVRARNLVASVRGTDFYMDVRGKQETYLCVCEGVVEMSEDRPGGFRSKIQGTHHKPYLFRNDRGDVWQTDHDMVGHSDEDIAALKALPPL